MEQRSHRAAVRSKQAEPGEVKAAAVAAELAGDGRTAAGREGRREDAGEVAFHGSVE